MNLDRGGEYQRDDFVDYLKTKGTLQKLNIHDTPQQAGVAERRNRTIAERIRAILHASGLPKFLWGEAVRHVVWLFNRTMTKAVEGMTPFEAVFGQKPNLKGVREWGEKVYVQIEGGTKLGGRVWEGHWLGMDEESKGTRIYWPDSKSVTVERNIYFNNSSASRFEEEQHKMGIIKTTADSHEKPRNPPVDNEHPNTQDSDAETPAKRI